MGAPAGGGFGAPAANPFASPQPAAPAQAEYEEDEDEDEEESYDFEAPPVPEGPDYDPSQFDPKVKAPRSMMKMVMMLVIGLALLTGGFFLGQQVAEIAQDRMSVNRRIALAQKMIKTIKPKVENFQAFFKPLEQRVTELKSVEAAAKYDPQTLAKLQAFLKSDFLFDPAIDLPPEMVILGQSKEHNPLAEIRAYTMGTMVLMQLISAHVAETKSEQKEIDAILAGGEGASDMFAMRFDPQLFLTFFTLEPSPESRKSLGLTAKGLYRVKRAITDPAESQAKWQEIKKEQNIEVELAEGQEDLPPKLIYELQTRSGKPIYVLADEIILIGRSEIFGASANAVERYEKRMIQIMKMAREVDKSCQPLIEKLEAQASEEML